MYVSRYRMYRFGERPDETFGIYSTSKRPFGGLSYPRNFVQLGTFIFMHSAFCRQSISVFFRLSVFFPCCMMLVSFHSPASRPLASTRSRTNLTLRFYCALKLCKARNKHNSNAGIQTAINDLQDSNTTKTETAKTKISECGLSERKTMLPFKNPEELELIAMSFRQKSTRIESWEPEQTSPQ